MARITCARNGNRPPGPSCGSASGAAAGVGAGNMDKKNEAEEEWKKESIGGKEQTGENPLGL